MEARRYSFFSGFVVENSILFTRKTHTILHLKPPYSWFRKCFFHVRYYGAFLVCIFVYGYLFVHVSFVIPLGGGLALFPLKCRKIQLHFWNGVSTVEHYAPFRIQWINVYEERERKRVVRLFGMIQANKQWMEEDVWGLSFPYSMLTDANRSTDELFSTINSIYLYNRILFDCGPKKSIQMFRLCDLCLIVNIRGYYLDALSFPTLRLLHTHLGGSNL